MGVSQEPTPRVVLIDLDAVLLGGGSLCPGVPEQLRRLAGHRVACAAVTSMPHRAAEQLLEACGLSRYVEVVASVGSSRWPSPTVLGQLAPRLLRWSGPPGRVVVISDAVGVVVAGRRAGLRTVAVTDGRTSAPDLADAWPDVLAATLPDAVTAALDLTDRQDVAPSPRTADMVVTRSA